MYYIICVYVCVGVCVGACGVQKKASAHLMLDLLLAVSHPMWVLILNLGLLHEQQVFLIAEPYFHSFLVLKKRSHYIVQIGLELTAQHRLEMNPQQPSSFSLLNGGITSIWSHTQFICSEEQFSATSLTVMK